MRKEPIYIDSVMLDGKKSYLPRELLVTVRGFRVKDSIEVEVSDTILDPMSLPISDSRETRQIMLDGRAKIMIETSEIDLTKEWSVKVRRPPMNFWERLRSKFDRELLLISTEVNNPGVR